MKIAFVHEWLTALAGSEQVLAAMLKMFPGAPLYVLVCNKKAIAGTEFAQHPILTSFLDRLPGATLYYRSLLPLMPLAVEQFDMREYDVIVSSSHAVAKGVLTRPDQVHVSYVHTPARYAWNLQAEYLEDDRSCRLKTFVTRIGLHYFRLWDVASANRVDHFVANSHNVAARIAKYYRREAQVIYPPVDIERYRYDRQREEYFLAVGRLVRYKRTDIICKAFSTLNLPLVVIGDGPESGRLRAMSSSNVKFLGWQPDAVLTDYLERCRALVFAADEDFGIVPVEAQAAGAPVIAYRRGGVLESVLPGVTGLLYDKQDAASLCGAIMKLVESGQPSDAGACRCSAERFSVARFCTAFQDFITAVR